MNFANPTGLTLGTSGTLAGKRFSVVGRVVMGMEEDGGTYYWNEFHLIDPADQSATLVHEETERGAQWKLFTFVEPSRVWTADEAAAHTVGDEVEIDGLTSRVTLVDESRVYFVEGRAPEGVEVGDVARYFNAMAGNRMYVVSWTGDDVEIFRGMDLPTHAVASAFQLRVPHGQLTGTPFTSTTPSRPGIPGGIIRLLVYASIVAIAIAGFLSCHATRRNRAFVPVKPQTPDTPIAMRASGQLDGKFWRVQGHALVEVRKPGAIYDRHEYQLVASDDTAAVLVHGLNSGKNDWCLFRTVEFDSPLTPDLAAARRVGEKIGAGSKQLEIKQLFQATVRSTDGQRFDGAGAGTVQYGFQAEGGESILLTRWTASNVTCWIGGVVAAKEVLAAFGRSSGASR